MKRSLFEFQKPVHKNTMEISDSADFGQSSLDSKQLLDEGKEECEKPSLKLNIKKNEDHSTRFHHFVANRQGRNANTGRFIFLDPKITADSDCSHKTK